MGELFSADEAVSKKNKKLRSKIAIGAIPASSVATVTGAEQVGSKYMLTIQWHLPHVKGVITDTIDRSQYDDNFMELRERAQRPEEVESQIVDAAYLAALDFLSTLPPDYLELCEKVSRDERVEILFLAIRLKKLLNPEHLGSLEKAIIQDQSRQEPYAEFVALAHAIATVIPPDADSQVAGLMLNYLVDFTEENWLEMNSQCEAITSKLSPMDQDVRLVIIQLAAALALSAKTETSHIVSEDENIQSGAA